MLIGENASVENTAGSGRQTAYNEDTSCLGNTGVSSSVFAGKPSDKNAAQCEHKALAEISEHEAEHDDKGDCG